MLSHPQPSVCTWSATLCRRSGGSQQFMQGVQGAYHKIPTVPRASFFFLLTLCLSFPLSLTALAASVGPRRRTGSVNGDKLSGSCVCWSVCSPWHRSTAATRIASSLDLIEGLTSTRVSKSIALSPWMKSLACLRCACHRMKNEQGILKKAGSCG